MARLNWEGNNSGQRIVTENTFKYIPEEEEIPKIYAAIAKGIIEGRITKVSQLPSAIFTFVHSKEEAVKKILPTTSREYQSGFYAIQIAMEPISWDEGCRTFKYHVTVLSRVTGKQDDFCRENTKTFEKNPDAWEHLNQVKVEAKKQSKNLIEHLKQWD